MKYLIFVGMIILILGFLVGCQTDSHHGKDGGCEGCAAGKAGGTAWCEGCDVGYVDGKKVKCEGCYTAKTGGPDCRACKK